VTTSLILTWEDDQLAADFQAIAADQRESGYVSDANRAAAAELAGMAQIRPAAAAPLPEHQNKIIVPGRLHVVRDRLGAAGRLYVDGEVFPYATADGFHVDVNRGSMAGVTMKMVASSVSVEDSDPAMGTEPVELGRI
jgi:hypothetical protein